MSIVRFEGVCLAYGLRPLLDEVSLAIEAGEKICLLGRNGEGKSSFMRLLAKEIEPDSGSIIFEKGLKVGSLPQTLPDADARSVFDVVAEGLSGIGHVLAQYHALIDEQAHGESLDATSLTKLESLQEKIEANDGWSFQTKINGILKRFGLDENQQMKELSGGWRRRVLLARALINEPDLLLLDEPTNHLDIDTIKWLEQRLKEFKGSLLFVSHDRAFVKSLASGIIELDRGNIAAFKGSYESYLVDKQKMLEDEARQDQLFDKRLSEEEVWIRQGIKARRTRNEGRVRALKSMRDERKRRIEKQGAATIKISEADKSGKLVVEVDGVSHAFTAAEAGGRLVIKDFSLTVIRGERIGLIGANGAGKTTLLRILLGKLNPMSGSVKLGSKLEVAYFDQLRGGLDPEKTVFDNVADGHDFINLNGNPKHVISYLNDFLFTAERARTPVKALSGGETNRLLLAKLFGRPSNVIVMDEPTNDLDVDTLELLEERLNEFTGTLLLTSHDRDFIDQVVTSTLVFEGQGQVSEYVGGYQDWVRQTGGVMAVESQTVSGLVDSKNPSVEHDKDTVLQSQVESKKKPVRKKMSYKLKHELEQLPAKIEALEVEISKLQSEMAASDFYSKEHEIVEKTIGRLAATEKMLEDAEERWLELEEAAEE
jgi:ATP-binding cassette subfamily F protein uup